MKDMWNKRYSIPEYVYGTEPNSFVKEYINSHTPQTILFAAEGEGRNAVYAASKGWNVYAVDYSEQAKVKADKLARQYDVQINFDVADLNDWQNNVKYDTIVLCYTHFPAETRQYIHRKLVGSLKPKGNILLEAFGKEQLRYNTGGPQNIEMLYNHDILQDDFRDFTIKQLETLDVELEEGIYHKGTANIVRMIAQKN